MTEAKLKRFKNMVEPRLGMLYRTARRLTGNRLDAEDLVQDTCLRAWEQLPPPRESVSLDHWLLRVLYHRFIDETRRRKRAPVQPLNGAADPTDRLPSAHAGPEELALHAESERALDAAWLRLERSQRVLLSLRAEGYGIGEIGKITDIGRDVLRARLHRARRSLARHLEDIGSEATNEARAGRGQ
jgi:RNA polymerase sigma-70 factor (ECF subfamily)